MEYYCNISVANVNQGEPWNYIFVLLDKKEKRERSSRGNGCLKKGKNKKGEERKTGKKSIIKNKT